VNPPGQLGRLSRRRAVFAAWTLLVLATRFPWPAGAHPDLLVQIEEVTKQLEKEPNNPELYLKRGELWRAHVEWEAAYADYERASALAPDLAIIDLARGRLFLDSGWPLSARAILDRFLSRQPGHVEALILRARACTRLNLRLAAAQDYTRAINLSPEPGPDLFIERAQVFAAEGRDYLPSALQGLDEGIRKLGPLVTLQLFAIDMELKQNNVDGALARLDQVAQKSPRKETWLARRGEILQQAGRPEEARQAFQAALASFQTLPPTRRNVPAMLELERRLRRQVERIDANSAGQAKPR